MGRQGSTINIGKYQWMLGFLGFLGCLGYWDLGRNVNNGAFVFFGFFGFFSWYWEYKLQQGVEDERLIQNRMKAKDLAFGISMAIVWVGAIFSNNLLLKPFPILIDYEYRYNFLIVLIAFAFALGLNLQSYLAYRYDTKE